MKSVTACRVLLVEDHPLLAEMMCEMLELLGHHATVAGSIAETLRAAAEAPFDLLLTDYRLPDGTGVDLLSRLKESGPIRAILLSAYDEGTLPEDQRGEFDAFLAKPVGMADLQRAVERLCPA